VLSAKEIRVPAKKAKKVVDRENARAYTNVTGDAHRGAPMTVL
jgi:hypothetical protein